MSRIKLWQQRSLWHKRRKFLLIFVDFFGKWRIILNRMDTRNYGIDAGISALEDLPRSKMVVGAKQLRKALTTGRAQKVFLASNADPAITEPIMALCQQNSVEYAWVRSMADLGKACGIEVGAAAAACVH